MQRDLLRLVELLEAADHLGRALDGVDFERSTADAELRDSTLWRLMKVGEAPVQLSEEVRGRHPEIEWHRAIGFRNPSCTATSISTWRSCTGPPPTASQFSRTRSVS